MPTCQFDEAWRGPCGKEINEQYTYCDKHTLSCCCCGEVATHSCSFCGQLVCGFPLCDNCTHNYNHSYRHNSKMHIRKE